MTDTKTISAIVGQPVQIKLQSMAGSTGYAWYLTTLDGGLALSSAVVVPTAPGVAPVNHIFDFLACTEGTYKVVFELKAAWRPEEAADTEIFEVEIKPKERTAKDEIEAALGGREFIHAAVANVGAQLEATQVVKYAAPMAATMIEYAAPMIRAQAAATPPVILYAAPMVHAGAYAVASPYTTVILYAAPLATTARTMAAYHSGTLNAATMVAYAAPIGPSTMAAHAMRYVDPCLQAVHPMYAAPAMFQPYAAPWVSYQHPMPPYAAPLPGTPQGCC